MTNEKLDRLVKLGVITAYESKSSETNNTVILHIGKEKIIIESYRINKEGSGLIVR